ncbi:MAG: hypothetical protein KAI66_14475 [Lentisphaeria bacterium]|nr:hypothetical protein [Lentisphaeria bacterium]
MNGRFLGVCLLAAALPVLAAEWRNVGPGGGGWIQSVHAGRHRVGDVFVGCDVGGFYRSADGGQSYGIQNQGLQDYWVECIVEHPDNPDVLFIAGMSGVYKSADGGRTWTWLRKGFPEIKRYSWSAPVGALVMDRENPNVLYAGIGSPRRRKWGAGAVYKSMDGGTNWSRVNGLGTLPAKTVVSGLLIDPRNREHLYLACDAGVYQSFDGGRGWKPTSTGLPHTGARRLAQCAFEPDTLYLTLWSPPGTNPWQGGVYKSTDGGTSWNVCNTGLKQSVGKPGAAGALTSNYDCVAVHPQDPDIAYVGGASWVNATVYQTIDGGKTWREIVRRHEDRNFDPGWITMWGPSVTCLSMSPLDPAILYFGTSGGVFKTMDAGANWEPVYAKRFPDGRIAGTGLEVTCLHNIMVHPTVPDRVYFGFYDIGLLISEDGGASMRRCVEGIAPQRMANSCFDMAFDPADPEHCWGAFGTWGTNIGVLAESADGGRTWKMMERNGLPEGRTRTLIAGAKPMAKRGLFCTIDGQGVFVSDDGGRFWKPANTGLRTREVRSLVRGPQNADVFWCVTGSVKGVFGGVYRSVDACETWRRVAPDLKLGDTKGLAVGGDGRTLYLAARDRNVGETPVAGGIWRSRDGGDTWTKTLVDDFAACVAVDPRDPTVVYVALSDHPYHDQCTGDGVKMSRDGGQTWVSLNSASLTCHQITTITVDSHDPDRIYVGTGGNGGFTTRITTPPR